MTLARIAAFATMLALVAACQKTELEPPVPLGPFALGHNIVVTDKMQKVPISREATGAEWEAAMKKAMEDRFGRYDGTKLYDFGISIDGYALAPPGVPVVLKPRSVLVITVNVWDDAARKKLNPEGKQLVVFEGASGKTFIGSGLTQSREEQMQILAFNAAKAVEDWLLESPEWFGLPPNPAKRVKQEPKPTSMSAPAPAKPAPAAAVSAPAASTAPPLAVTATPLPATSAASAGTTP